MDKILLSAEHPSGMTLEAVCEALMAEIAVKSTKLKTAPIDKAVIDHVVANNTFIVHLLNQVLEVQQNSIKKMDSIKKERGSIMFTEEQQLFLRMMLVKGHITRIDAVPFSKEFIEKHFEIVPHGLGDLFKFKSKEIRILIEGMLGVVVSVVEGVQTEPKTGPFTEQQAAILAHISVNGVYNHPVSENIPFCKGFIEKYFSMELSTSGLVSVRFRSKIVHNKITDMLNNQ